MELFCHIFQCHGLVVSLYVILHGYETFILHSVLYLNLRQLVHCNDQCIDG